MADELEGVKATLAEVRGMLDQISRALGMLGEDQALWQPADDVWSIARSVAHCVNCEHRAVVEFERALRGEETPETVGEDTGIFAWHGPTPYLLSRIVGELRDRIEGLAGKLDESHLDVEAVRYPQHPSRKLVAYVGTMLKHTGTHHAAIGRKLAEVPESAESHCDLKQVYPDYGKGKVELGG